MVLDLIIQPPLQIVNPVAPTRVIRGRNALSQQPFVALTFYRCFIQVHVSAGVIRNNDYECMNVAHHVSQNVICDNVHKMGVCKGIGEKMIKCIERHEAHHSI